VHLRGGKVARAWFACQTEEDYRTDVLAQRRTGVNSTAGQECGIAPRGRQKGVLCPAACPLGGNRTRSAGKRLPVTACSSKGLLRSDDNLPNEGQAWFRLGPRSCAMMRMILIWWWLQTKGTANLFGYRNGIVRYDSGWGDCLFASGGSGVTTTRKMALPQGCLVQCSGISRRTEGPSM